MDKDRENLNTTDFKRFAHSLEYALKSIEQDAFAYCYKGVPEYEEAFNKLNECINQIKNREVE